MGYWSLTKPQASTLRSFVRGKTVFDLGAGDLSLAILVKKWGAARVVGVDRKRMPSIPGIERIEGDWAYSDVKEVPEVALLSWPINSPNPRLLKLVKKSRSVVYLGKNTDGTCCGWPGLFEHLLERKVLSYKPDRANTLIIYGAAGRHPRETKLGEEIGGLMMDKEMFSYEHLEAGR